MKTNWALIGYGGMGSWHVKQLRTLEEINIKGVYDIDPERVSAAKQAGLNCYDSLEALLADKDVQFVTIATPNDTHKDIAIQALRAGKHVISEKPVTINSAELHAIISVSRDTGKLFTVHQNRRWDEDFLVIKKLFDQNALGNVFNIESRVHGSRGIPSDWRNQKYHGGGMILDWGVHMLDQLLLMVNEPIISVYCTGSFVTNEEVDDGFHAVLTYSSGLKAIVEVGTSNFINLPRWYMQGENGTTVVTNWELDGKTVMVSDWEKRDAVPVVTAAGLTKTMAPRTSDTIQEYPLPTVKSDVRDFYRNFIEAMDGKTTQLVTHKQMLRVMRLMEAMFRSIDNGAVIHERI